MSGPAAPSAFDKDHPFPARVSENRLLSRAGSGKETRHFVVRLEGTNAAQGLSMLAASGLSVITAANLAEAADKVVAAADPNPAPRGAA
jgi:sulfite reductase (NADPH) flavoprotein alpha-component